MIAVFVVGSFNNVCVAMLYDFARIVVYDPIFFLLTLWSVRTIEFYNIKWLCKINVYALHCTRTSVVFDNTYPFFWVIQVYATRAQSTCLAANR